MSRDLEQLLHDTAATPTHVPDPHELVVRGQRRRRGRQAAIGVGALAVVGAVAALVSGPLTPPRSPQILEQPTAPATAAPSPGTDADPDGDAPDRAARIAQLEDQRRQLLASMSELNGELARLRVTDDALAERERAGEDVSAQRASVADRIGELTRRLEDLDAQRFAVEQQLVELGALDDPVAVARAAATDDDRALAEAFTAFARAPSAATAAAVPFTSTVELGLGPNLRRQVDAADLADPSVWVFDAALWRARDGDLSALRLLQDGQPTQVLAGEHPHCASPPVPAPEGYEDHRRVSIEPVTTESCLDWWTVDLFLDRDGRIAAVTLDLWEP